jgi:hypothetical protein
MEFVIDYQWRIEATSPPLLDLHPPFISWLS